MAWSTVFVAKIAPRSLLYVHACPLRGWRSHDPPRTRDTWATVKKQLDPACSDGAGAAGVGADEGVEVDDDGLVGDDAADSGRVPSSLEHPAAMRAATTTAAPRDPRSLGTAFPSL
jgi:hypothetical protein